MAMGRPKAELTLNADERAQLESLARSRSLPAGLVQRANLVLACAEGAPNSAVAKRYGVTNATVGKWRRRFVEQRIAGLHDELRPGKPRSIDDEQIAGLLTTTLHHKPKDGATHWSVRGLAARRAFLYHLATCGSTNPGLHFALPPTTSRRRPGRGTVTRVTGVLRWKVLWAPG